MDFKFIAFSLSVFNYTLTWRFGVRVVTNYFGKYFERIGLAKYLFFYIKFHVLIVAFSDQLAACQKSNSSITLSMNY